MTSAAKSRPNARARLEVEICRGPQKPIKRAVTFRRDYFNMGRFPCLRRAQDVGHGGGGRCRGSKPGLRHNRPINVIEAVKLFKHAVLYKFGGGLAFVSAMFG